METILHRIEKIAINEGIKITALERRIGASKGVLSRAINNGTDIQTKWIQAIVENYPQYSERWLLTGEGKMIKDNTISTSVVCEPTASYGRIPEADIYYKMYKEKDSEVKELSEKIGEQRKGIEALQKEVERLRKENENFAEEITLMRKYTQNLLSAESARAVTAQIK